MGKPRKLGDRLGHAVFRCRDVAAPLMLAVLVASTRPQDFLASPELDRSLDAAGLTLMALGLLLRAWVIASSGVRRAGVARHIGAAVLCEEGAYAWCRNPLYVANATLLGGIALIFDSRWLVLIGLPAALVAIASLVAAEESVLRARFGAQYERYCTRVSRFRLRRPLSQPAIAGGLNWRRALRREHGTMFAAASAAIGLLAIEDFHRRRLAAWRRHEPVLLAAWIVAALAWAAVRHLKRTARLADVPGTAPPLENAAACDDVAA